MENIQILSHELNDADSSTAIIQRSPFSKCVPKKTINNLYKKVFVIYGLLPRIFVLRRESSKKDNNSLRALLLLLRIVSSSLLYSEGTVIFFLLVCMVVFLVGFCVCLFICADLSFYGFVLMYQGLLYNYFLKRSSECPLIFL